MITINYIFETPNNCFQGVISPSLRWRNHVESPYSTQFKTTSQKKCSTHQQIYPLVNSHSRLASQLFTSHLPINGHSFRSDVKLRKGIMMFPSHTSSLGQTHGPFLTKRRSSLHRRSCGARTSHTEAEILCRKILQCIGADRASHQNHGH